MRARLRAHRWVTVGCVALIFVLTSVLGRSSQVKLPAVPLPVPTFILISVGTMVLITFPLMSAMPDFERTLLREQWTRALRVLVVVLGASLTITLTCAVSDPGLAVEVWDFLPAIIIMAALAIASVVVVGDMAWLVPATLGFLALMLTASLNNPLDRFLYDAPLSALVTLVVVASALYVWRGPRPPL